MRTNDIPRIIVARPRAVPIPLPLIALGPTRLNLIPPSCQLQTRYSPVVAHSHRCILQHVRDDEETDHTASDVYLIQL